MTLHPAAAHSGITFYRSDVKANRSRILARYDHVTDTRLCTKLPMSRVTASELLNI